MTRRIAGRPPREDDALRVDYADVLHQAVANERFRIMQAVKDALRDIPVTRGGHEYGGPRSAADYRKDFRQRIEGLWDR